MSGPFFDRLNMQFYNRDNDAEKDMVRQNLDAERRAADESSLKNRRITPLESPLKRCAVTSR